MCCVHENRELLSSSRKEHLGIHYYPSTCLLRADSNGIRHNPLFPKNLFHKLNWQQAMHDHRPHNKTCRSILSPRTLQNSRINWSLVQENGSTMVFIGYVVQTCLMQSPLDGRCLVWHRKIHSRLCLVPLHFVHPVCTPSVQFPTSSSLFSSSEVVALPLDCKWRLPSSAIFERPVQTFQRLISAPLPIFALIHDIKLPITVMRALLQLLSCCRRPLLMKRPFSDLFCLFAPSFCLL